MSPILSQTTTDQNWFSHADEGQLSVDVFRDADQLVVRSIVAGVQPKDLEISIHGDLLTIRGSREMHHATTKEKWFHRECYWGQFSRSMVLPLEVVAEAATSSIKNGILEIRIPIREHARKVPIAWEE